jgi:DNA-binding LytR/AlgR family response regulator
MGLRSIIVDDDELFRDLMVNLCEKVEELEIAGVFSNALDAMSFLEKNQIDVVFLDIEMPDITGIDMLKLHKDMPQVVLITAKEHYAIQAYEYDVTYYLLKPVHLGDLMKAIQKVKKNLDSKYKPTSNEIYIKVDGIFVKLYYDQILFLQSQGDYVEFIIPEKKYITHATLKNIEDNLDKNLFYKVHRSYIVNLKKIDRIEDNVIVIQKYVIPVSRTKKQDLFRQLSMLE